MIKIAAVAIAFVILVIIVVIVMIGSKTNSVASPTYIGCYADDGSDRTFSNKFRQDVDLASCFLVGKNAGVKYVGYQGEPNGTTGTCWYGDSYDKHGKAADCIVKDATGNTIGQWDLAVYQIA